MLAEWRGGMLILKECSGKRTTHSLAAIVGNNLKAMATPIGCSAPVTAICYFAERRPTMSDYDNSKHLYAPTKAFLLNGIQPFVKPILLHQFAVCSLFYDFAIV